MYKNAFNKTHTTNHFGHICGWRDQIFTVSFNIKLIPSFVIELIFYHKQKETGLL